ncbi:hypothetical protein R1sor_009218 [Riccia sorocarpa]|uniref:Uncharacterized protein n=1 Tax=Riccia sorocarpa TaxID=122646 RepID=A0ABD3HB63_9MARC
MRLQAARDASPNCRGMLRQADASAMLPKMRRQATNQERHCRGDASLSQNPEHDDEDGAGSPTGTNPAHREGGASKRARRCIAKRAGGRHCQRRTGEDDDFVRAEACEDLTLGSVLTVRWPTRDTEPPPYRLRSDRGKVLVWE